MKAVLALITIGTVSLLLWSVPAVGLNPSNGVVVDAPALSQHKQVFDRVEDLSVEELICEFGVERFAVAVLAWRAGFDVQYFGSWLSSDLRRSFARKL
jgi:hypothetical protein